MALIKSISGIRGTIGGIPGDNLTPFDIVKFSSAFAGFLIRKNAKDHIKMVIGRDARISGEMVSQLVCGTLMSMGVDVVDLGLSTTPTVEIMVPELDADGGIIITASHNPVDWNALKLLNHKGEFISAEHGAEILEISDKEGLSFKTVGEIGSCIKFDKAIEIHIQKICSLLLVDSIKIKKAGFRIAVDCVNSTGGLAIIPLLKELGVKQIVELNTLPDGKFPHDPEPLPENLQDLSRMVVESKSDLGFAVDPDVDRLAIVDENGKMFGEEYTLVAVADYILRNTPGNTVSNLSSTRALRDITEKFGARYYASSVGEVNVVEMMKKKQAVIGGEGNGGVIYPELHYGRDALVGIALFLSHLAKCGISCSELRKEYPDYFISKNKIEVPSDTNIKVILNRLYEKYKAYNPGLSDGLKIDFEHGWVHLRKSNTEPVIRIYSESSSREDADSMANSIINEVKRISGI